MASNPNDLDAEIGQRVNDAAREAGVTHLELAPPIGVSDRTFSRLLVGQAKWKLVDVNTIADILGVDAGYLAFGAGEAS